MKKLDIVMQNEVRGYLHYAFPLCILRCYKNYLPLIMNKYVKCCANSYPGFSFIDGYSYVSETISNTPLVTNKIPYSLDVVLNNICDVITSSIMSDYYVVLFTDEFYLQGRPAYNKIHYYHELLIYGFDETNYFCIAFHENELIKTSINISEVENACKKGKNISWQGSYPLITIKPKKLWCEYEFSFNIFTNDLYEYATSQMNYEYISFNNTFGHKVYFGLECNNLISDIAKENVKCENTIFPTIHLWYEHKRSLLERIDYITNQLKLCDLQMLYKEYSRIVQQANSIRMLFIKSKLSDSKNIYGRISTNIDELQKAEKTLLFDYFHL